MSLRVWLPLIVAALVFALTVVFCGAGFWIYFDFPSLILVPVAPLLCAILAHGWAGARNGFGAPLKEGSTKRQLESAAAFWKSLGLATWSFGAMGAMLGLIAVLANLRDSSKVGPNAAIALITLLYAALFSAGVVMPFLAAARRRLAEAD